MGGGDVARKTSDSAVPPVNEGRERPRSCIWRDLSIFGSAILRSLVPYHHSLRGWDLASTQSSSRVGDLCAGGLNRSTTNIILSAISS